MGVACSFNPISLVTSWFLCHKGSDVSKYRPIGRVYAVNTSIVPLQFVNNVTNRIK
jgi:hypothetical protein